MLQQSPEAILADIAGTDVLVPVSACAQRRFRIVRVNRVQPLEPDLAFELFNRAL
jgi:hypothetical protein